MKSSLLSSASSAVEITVNALPTVVISTVKTITQLLHVANEAVAYLGVEIDMIRLRQDAENAPVIAALKVIALISASQSDVDMTTMSYDEKIVHLELCFELIGKINKLLKDMDKAQES